MISNPNSWYACYPARRPRIYPAVGRRRVRRVDRTP